MRTKAFNLQKYINKLKVAKAPVYVIGQESGLALKNFKHPAYNDTKEFPKELQIAEFYNKTNSDHTYFSEGYKSLLTNIKQGDQEYSATNKIEDKVKISRSQMASWKEFVSETSKNLPEEDFKVRQDTLIKLEDIWMRFKRRNKQTIAAEEILPFHYEFTKHYNFDLPVHHKNLGMMLHPHWGYLCKFTQHDFNFNHIVNFYYDEFVSSYFRNIGRVKNKTKFIIKFIFSFF